MLLCILIECPVKALVFFHIYTNDRGTRFCSEAKSQRKSSPVHLFQWLFIQSLCVSHIYQWQNLIRPIFVSITNTIHKKNCLRHLVPTCDDTHQSNIKGLTDLGYIIYTRNPYSLARALRRAQLYAHFQEKSSPSARYLVVEYPQEYSALSLSLSSRPVFLNVPLLLGGGVIAVHFFCCCGQLVRIVSRAAISPL